MLNISIDSENNVKVISLTPLLQHIAKHVYPRLKLTREPNVLRESL